MVRLHYTVRGSSHHLYLHSLYIDAIPSLNDMSPVVSFSDFSSLLYSALGRQGVPSQTIYVERRKVAPHILRHYDALSALSRDATFGAAALCPHCTLCVHSAALFDRLVGYSYNHQERNHIGQREPSSKKKGPETHRSGTDCHARDIFKILPEEKKSAPGFLAQTPLGNAYYK